MPKTIQNDVVLCLKAFAYSTSGKTKNKIEKMEVNLREEARIYDFQRTHKLWTKNESVKYKNHFLSRRRTKILTTLGNIEFSMLYIYIVLQGIIFGSLIPSSDAKLFPSHSSTHQIFHNSFTEGDKIRPHPTLDVTLGRTGQNITSQGKLFKKLITPKYYTIILNFQIMVQTFIIPIYHTKGYIKFMKYLILIQRQYLIIIDHTFNVFTSKSQLFLHENMLQASSISL